LNLEDDLFEFMPEKRVSVIVPTLNEEGNIDALVERIAAAFQYGALTGEIIFVDDHSIDGTRQAVERLVWKYALSGVSVRFFLKSGKRGKAQSLIEGFQYAQFEIVAMIDADLQYPPEAIPDMVSKLSKGCDIVVANRLTRETGIFRSLISKSFVFLFGRFLHGLECDVQSGLKVFRRKIIREVRLDPSPWAFDMEFLLSAQNSGYSIGSVDVVFSDRRFGKSKVNIIRTSIEIGLSALKLRFKGRPPVRIHPEENDTMRGAGVAHKKIRFITHSTLHHDFSALRTFAPWQRNFLIGALVFFVIGFLIDPLSTGIAFFAFLNTLYFFDVFFNLFLVLRSLRYSPEISSTEWEMNALDDNTLPVYSVLCPLYREAHMLPHFVAGISALCWPKDKLDVLLLLEENDEETIREAKHMNLPSFVRIVVVPHSFPKTKPKACNYGLSFARGKYVVIYDAEDIPDIWQLKKAYLGFQKVSPEVLCLQAKLNYFNSSQNLLTRLFSAEYSLWFDIILPGLQTINTSIPLGGTSNHFRTEDLKLLEGWDPFNVTEDCDLGVRLFARGYRTAIIDSVTLEEANSNVRNWIRQRSRWVKGYMQTYLVHMRRPIQFVKQNGIHAFLFQLVVGAKIVFMLINPLLWLITIAYIVLYEVVGAAIRELFPPAVFYMAVVSLVFGNFLYIYYYMIGCAKRQHFDLIKYVFLVPFYWILVSIAAVMATYQLFTKPHYWEKTNHGLHLLGNKKKQLKQEEAENISLSDGNIVFDKDILEVSEKPGFFRNIMKHVTSGESMLIYAMVAGNFFNFAFNAFLGRVLAFPDLALVIFVSTLWYVFTIFINGFSTTVNHNVSYLYARKGAASAHMFFRKLLHKGLVWALFASLLWIALSPVISDFFQVHSWTVCLLFTPAIFFGLVNGAFQSYLQGNMRFAFVAVTLLAETISKLLLAIAFVFFERGDMAYLAIPMSLMFSAFSGWVLAQSVFPRKRTVARLHESTDKFPIQFYASAVFTNMSSIAFLSIDTLLAKHFFPEDVAGQYALVSLIGKMVYFLGMLPTVFMITLVSYQEGLKKNSQMIFARILFATFGLLVAGVILFGIFGYETMPLLFGDKALSIVYLLPVYAWGIAFFTLSNVIVLYHLARHQYSFSVVSCISSLILIVAISVFHRDPKQIAHVVFWVSAMSLLIFSLMHSMEQAFPFIRRGMRDLWGIFVNGLPKSKAASPGLKRILVFNWRDTTHKYAGGAEMYVHEVSKVWVRQGNHVTVFCGNDGTQKRYEVIDGVHIVRRGGFYLVYIWAFLYYIFRFRGKYDVVIDCENGIPFFTPLYVGVPVFALMHHVHQTIFFRDLPKPLARIASFLEKDLMPVVYKNVKFITVSESSRKEMQDIGIGTAGIDIVYPGVQIEKLAGTLSEKNDFPTVLYLGRLKSYKSVDVLIRAFHQVLKRVPNAHLVIAGSGDEERNLKKLANDLELNEDAVSFLGHVSEEEKIRLLKGAWVLVNPSYMEGWGIVAIEANACGTPVIASNVPGLRDSVRHEHSGILVPYGDVAAFSESIIRLLENTSLRLSMSANAIEWANGFDWGISSKKFFGVMRDVL